MTIRIILGSVLKASDTCNLLKYMETKMGFDFTPYWKHILMGAVELGDRQFHNMTPCKPSEHDTVVIKTFN